MHRGLLTAISGLGAAILMWVLTVFGANNLHPGERASVEIILVCVAVVVGAAAGSLIGRRAGRPNLVFFGVTAGGVAGGLCGASYALIMGITYVVTFGGTPINLLDWVVVLIAYPVFALLGAFVGAVPGTALGALGGWLAARNGSRRGLST